MGVVDLLKIASMPVLEVLLITAIGLFLALDRVDILGENSRKYLNKLVYFVFNPALVGSNLAQTITYESICTLWFMPLNVLITYILGSVLGWILVKVTRVPNNLKGILIGSCSAGNLGPLLIIIIPAMCKEKGGPFGTPEICHSYGISYASFSMALGTTFCWSYAYNVIRIYSVELLENSGANSNEASDELSGTTSMEYRRPLLPSMGYPVIEKSCPVHKAPTAAWYEEGVAVADFENKVSCSSRLKSWIIKCSKNINLELLPPSTIAVILGFTIGTIPPIRSLLIGNDATLHVIDDSVYMLGDAAVPAITLILGASLLRGIKGSKIQLNIVMGVVAIRYILLPLLGILIVKGALHLGILQFDPLFVFVLLLQYAVPPAMNISTITEKFGVGEREGSVILFWTYALAPIALTLWSTLFLWLVAS